MIKGYIYQIKNKTNNKCYIGQTKKDVEFRFYQHKYYLNKNKHANTYLQNSWNKYGENNFEFKVVKELESNNLYELTELLNKTEIEYIKIYNSTINNNGYNIQFGGHNSNMNIETKNKISKKLKGENNGQYGIKRTDEEKIHLSKKLKGRTPWNKGVKISSEHKSKISKSLKQHPSFKNKHHSKETKEKIRNKKINTHHDDEAKIKIGKSSKQFQDKIKYSHSELICNVYLQIMNGHKVKDVCRENNISYYPIGLQIKNMNGVYKDIIDYRIINDSNYKTQLENSFLYKLKNINPDYERKYSSLKLDCFTIYKIYYLYNNNAKELSNQFSCDIRIINKIINKCDIYEYIINIMEENK